MSHSIVFRNIERIPTQGLMSKNKIINENNKGVTWACFYGSLGVLKWIHVKYDLSKQDIQIFDLKNACVNGHYEIVLFLATTYGFTTEDTATFINEISEEKRKIIFECLGFIGSLTKPAKAQ